MTPRGHLSIALRYVLFPYISMLRWVVRNEMSERMSSTSGIALYTPWERRQKITDGVTYSTLRETIQNPLFAKRLWKTMSIVETAIFFKRFSRIYTHYFSIHWLLYPLQWISEKNNGHWLLFTWAMEETRVAGRGQSRPFQFRCVVFLVRFWCKM